MSQEARRSRSAPPGAPEAPPDGSAPRRLVFELSEADERSAGLRGLATAISVKVALGEYRETRSCAETLAQVSEVIERERAQDAEDAVRFLLDGLGVVDIGELRQLVALARCEMPPNG